MIKVILIGYGHLGKWHAEKISSFDNVNFVAIVERDEKQQELAKEKHPGVSIVSSVSDAGDFDTAVIVTPTSTHFNIAKDLLDNDKNVFCEKPVCSTHIQANELKTIVQEKDITFQVGHSERFHEVWDIKKSEIKKHLDTKNYTMKINRYAPFKGRATDVDVVQDLMIHDIDLLLYLTGDRPVSVEAKGFKSLTDKWDYVEACFELKSGSRATLTVGRNSVKEVREVEFNSDKGAILIDLFTCKIHETIDQIEDQKYVRESFYSKRDHLMEEHRCFYESIEKSTPPVVNIEDGRRAVEIVEQVLESVEKKQKIEL